MDSDELRRGERKQVFFFPGEDDPDGPYQMQFYSKRPFFESEYVTLTPGTYEDDREGFYVWARSYELPEGSGITSVALPAGDYHCRLRYASGQMIDIDLVGVLHVGN